MSTRWTVPLLASFALAACTPKPDSNICSRVPSLSESVARAAETKDDRPQEAAASAAMRAEEFASSCIQRWAYRFAQAPGPAPEIARAAVAGCEIPIVESVRKTAHAYDSTIEGYESRDRQARKEFMELAVFYVVQARAGRCKAD